MRSKGTILVIWILSLVFVTGCWNSRELSELSIVTAMGVDQVAGKREYRVSFQIVNPGSVATGMTGGGDGDASPVTVYTETGRTLFEAIRKAAKLSPRQLFFAHVRVVVIGETLARAGIRPLFDIFERDAETRLTSRVVVARGNMAEWIITARTPLEKIPANTLDSKMKFAEKLWSENVKTEVGDVVRALNSDGRELMLNGISLIGAKQQGKDKSNVESTLIPALLHVKGLALFKGGKLQRWLDGSEARGAVWITNKMKSTIVNLDYKEAKQAISIEEKAAKTTVQAELHDGRPIFHLSIRQEGIVGEVQCPIDLNNYEEIEKLNRAWSKETEREVMAAVQVAQEMKSDIFGFGEEMRRAYPKVWENLKRDWNNTFAKSSVDLKVDSYIRQTGLRSKPYILKEDQ